MIKLHHCISFTSLQSGQDMCLLYLESLGWLKECGVEGDYDLTLKSSENSSIHLVAAKS